MAQNKAVIKALNILELISKSEEGLTLSEIAKDLDMPKASAFDILKALYQEDAVYYKDEKLKTYVIGSKIFTIGQSYTKNSNFLIFSEPLLREFADKYDATCFGCKRIGRKVSYVFKYESPRNRISTKDVGEEDHLYESIAGLTILSFLKHEKRCEIIERMIKKDFEGDRESVELKKMVNQINSIKARGYGFSNGFMDRLTTEIAIPVFDFESRESGVIYATRLAFDEKEERETEANFIKDFIEIAKKISRKQGYQQ
ncbi:MAG: IclR family transcriptional regulator [Gammaproteobacteria bacterium]|nr:IclR family transcriptional regulator [Gammaproteobacteria bacterium]